MRILYVTTLSNTLNAFLVPHIELLLNLGHEVDIACNIDNKINSKLIERGCKVFDIKFQRSPLTKQNYLAYKMLKKILDTGEYDIVHTHTPIASMCVRLACKKLKKSAVIYTAHGFHFYSGAPFRNWMIYYPIEKFLSKYTDILITINNEDYYRAKNYFFSKEVIYIPGVGIDTSKFNKVKVDNVEKRKQLEIPINAFVVLSVGELNENKNHEIIIKAIEKLKNPDIYYIICGTGSNKEYLNSMIQNLNLEEQVRLLGNRNDIAEILQISDTFVFPSFREGLSVALMEAMASGLPVICSNIRGNRDLIEHKKGGYLVNPSDLHGFACSIKKMYESKDLRESFGEFNKNRVERYSLKNVLKELTKVYKTINQRKNL